MSTKGTLAYKDDRYHLYTDCMDEGCVWLEIAGPFHASLGPSEPITSVRIPIDEWETMRLKSARIPSNFVDDDAKNAPEQHQRMRSKLKALARIADERHETIGHLEQTLNTERREYAALQERLANVQDKADADTDALRQELHTTRVSNAELRTTLRAQEREIVELRAALRRREEEVVEERHRNEDATAAARHHEREMALRGALLDRVAGALFMTNWTDAVERVVEKFKDEIPF